ncbi:uncharacterized protein TRAVEDRAFT_168912 [Trametes versicolor FP-101664 SS1]|uniref:uncharacterized protein n=1 Tax=Trametes versicolor (strain FP-101664) TaxID=717944 RepID=UPI0004623565|nr:uncharacterized protein TRAVEDRAFT_168912 [Trametes versicolor FP-101664 SS1]EIW57266.1 hypothetical protein TRAVEDRAFT_168912 [Trametes versicolor FP-101664 SS1]
MPTATATTTAPSSVLALKASTTLHSSSSSSTAATLRSLYPRAARAFLQRDVALTHSLLSSAFSILSSPASVVSVNDALASQRRKWDILRVTFETTLYSSPPAAQDPESLPSALRTNFMLSPEPFIAALHNRSLLLFTPAESPQKPSSAFLPSQILITLVLASLKLDCIDVGRNVIEDWLAKHGQEDVPEDPKGYAKVIELYCLHVLPRLQDWDYAEDFLAYERELPHDVRQQYTASLRQLRAEAAADARAQAAAPAVPSPSSSASSSRSASPTPSDAYSYASSSSARTATPRAVTPFTPSQSSTPKPQEHASERRSTHSASSQSVASAATERTITPASASRERAKATRPARARLASRQAGSRSRSAGTTGPTSSSSSASVSIPPPSAVFREPGTASGSTARAPSTLALLRASAHGLLQGMSRARAFACVVLFVVLPLVSFVLRLRKRRLRVGGTGGAANGGTVDAVRRRLRGAEAQRGVVGQVWEEIVRAVLDTVRMAGRGLV